MKLFLLLGLLCCAAATPIDDTNALRAKLDWSKIRSMDLQVDKHGNVSFVPGGRIIGGDTILRGSSPWQAAVINYQNFCGGSLITLRAVLTAAHCTVGAGGAVTVVLGAHNITALEDSQQIFASNGISSHSDYSPPPNLMNDIAVVFLFRDAVLGQYVQLVSMAPKGTDNFAGVTAIVTGWGMVSDDSLAISDLLNGVQVEVITNEICNLYYGGGVNDGMLCTSGEGVKGSCRGDSGGPLTYNGSLIGIVSFGSGDGCESGDPTGYTRVSEYRDWIETTVGV